MSVSWGTVHHHNFRQAADHGYNAAVTAPPGRIILIIGPTGAGKTSLLAYILNLLVGAPETWPDGELRYVSLECDREAPGAITRNIAIDLNRALGNPFVSLALPIDGEKPSFGRIRVSLNEHDLRECVRILAAIRRTRYIGLDGMENIVPRREISAEARFDSIKSLVRPHKTYEPSHEVNLIMAGHYSLLSFWRANAQLARRVTEIPVLPYSKTARDIERFEELLHTISRFYPLRQGASLRDWNELLFVLSVGCIGLLQKLLDDAIVEMLYRKGRFLELKDVVAAAPPKEKLDEIVKDVEGFWPYVKSSVSPDLVSRMKARTSRSSDDSDAKKPVKKRGRVGRKVGPRDPVGGIA